MNTVIQPLHDVTTEQAFSAVHCQEQIAIVATALEEAISQNNFTEFYRLFRSSSLPFIPVGYQEDARGLFRLAFDLLHRLGGISPATALAIENHFYVLSAIAAFPVRHDTDLALRRRSLLQEIMDDRLLVANTNSLLHGSKLGTMGTQVRRDGNAFRVSGKSSFTSLASQGDMLVFISIIENEGPAVFAIRPMQQNPAIEIGPYLFPSAMLDSDTRQITFHDLYLPPESLIAAGDGGTLSLIFSFEMTWHKSLLGAVFLGAASRSIEEVRKFLRSTLGRDGHPLSELDGMVVDVGRLVLAYCSARAVVMQAGEALSAVNGFPDDVDLLEKALNLADAAKYGGTLCAEATVTAARRIVGARTFTGKHPLERLTQEVMFGVLAADVHATIERRFGQEALQDRPFLGEHL